MFNELRIDYSLSTTPVYTTDNILHKYVQKHYDTYGREGYEYHSEDIHKYYFDLSECSPEILLYLMQQPANKEVLEILVTHYKEKVKRNSSTYDVELTLCPMDCSWYCPIIPVDVSTYRVFQYDTYKYVSISDELKRYGVHLSNYIKLSIDDNGALSFYDWLDNNPF